MTTTTDVRTGIQAADEAFEARFEAGDAAGLAALYSQGAVLLPPGRDFVSGAAGIQAFWQGAIDLGLKEARLETTEVTALGDAAVSIGKYTLVADGGEVADEGKFLVVWKNEQGTWKLHRDVWNSSRSQ